MSIDTTPRYWQPIPEEEIEKEFNLIQKVKFITGLIFHLESEEEIEKEFNLIQLRTSLEQLTKEQLIEQFIELVLLNGNRK